MKEDQELKIIICSSIDSFEHEVNSRLKEGGWRITQTDVSIPDCTYWAVMIKAKIKE